MIVVLQRSPLIPLKEGQLLDYATWDAHTSEEHKWELWDGIPFHSDRVESKRLVIALIFSMGLDRFVEILPEESKIILKSLL
jgi:hypothetical protein